jgi:hypothetical protein
VIRREPGRAIVLFDSVTKKNCYYSIRQAVSGGRSMKLTDSALPGLFRAGDTASLEAQRRFLMASRLRLGFLVVAATTGAFSLYTLRRVDLAAVATVVALVGAVVVEIWLLTDRPEQAWYDGRALAESAKTLAWRFAVGGAPLDNSMNTQTAEMRLIEQLTALLRDAPGPGIGVSGGATITQSMREMRAAGLDERRRAYISERIDGQRRWYESKALYNRKAARRWRLALLVIESAGVFAALLRAIGVVRIDLAGIAAAIAAAGVAWLSLKQHESLARAYAYAAIELTLATTRLQKVTDEREWSFEVDNAESAISREHTMWRASRTTI